MAPSIEAHPSSTPRAGHLVRLSTTTSSYDNKQISTTTRDGQGYRLEESLARRGRGREILEWLHVSLGSRAVSSNNRECGVTFLHSVLLGRLVTREILDLRSRGGGGVRSKTLSRDRSCQTHALDCPVAPGGTDCASAATGATRVTLVPSHAAAKA